MPPARDPSSAAGTAPDPAAKQGVAPAQAPRRSGRPSGGVAVIAGGLLQDLEDRLRRDLAPIEERVRPGEEQRGLAGAGGPGVGPAVAMGGAGGDPRGPLVVVLPPARAESTREPGRGAG